MSVLKLDGRRVLLTRPLIMGIVNVTPDSFSDGGVFLGRDKALKRIEAIEEEGADIVDVGGESTRPKAVAVSVEEELDRVIPVIEACKDVTDAPISVDTSKPEVMRAAIAAGAAMINDVRALRMEGATEAAAKLDVPVCLMHMLGEPAQMQDKPFYMDVVSEVRAFLASRVHACIDAGLRRENLIVDPGFGFGKTVDHNLQLLKHLNAFADIGVPLLVGLSRKSTIGAVLDAPVDQRLMGSAAAALMAVERGANIVRVHDVAETRQVLQIFEAVTNSDASPSLR